MSPIPQTTRNTIRGIVTRPAGQIVFLDTPGYHLSERSINVHMRQLVDSAIGEVDAIVYLVDASRRVGPEEIALATIVANCTVPVVVVKSKSDLPAELQLDLFVKERGISAKAIIETRNLDRPDQLDGKKTGVDALIHAILTVLPEGPAWYPEEYYTDQEPRFRIAEIVRERAILRARQEVPHALFVDVADLEEDQRHYRARVFIYVERDSQKGILVGAGAKTITAIRKESEKILADLFPKRVRLSIQVKVRAKWRTNESILSRLIR